MEYNKKQCPFCGEEIQAAAKKCRHCGEWLQDQISDAANQTARETHIQESFSNRKTKVNHLETPVSDFVPFLFWTGVIAAFISMSHQCEAYYFSNPHKWMQIMQWATYIPEWVADLLGGLVDVIFAYALYAGMRLQIRPMSGLLITNIIITVLVSISTLFINLDLIKDEDDFGMTIFALTILVTFIVSIMIGIQFIRYFSGLLNKLGWGMLLSLLILIPAVVLISDKESNMTNTIISFIGFGVTSYLLYIQKELLTD